MTRELSLSFSRLGGGGEDARVLQAGRLRETAERAAEAEEPKRDESSRTVTKESRLEVSSKRLKRGSDLKNHSCICSQFVSHISQSESESENILLIQ